MNNSEFQRKPINRQTWEERLQELKKTFSRPPPTNRHQGRQYLNMLQQKKRKQRQNQYNNQVQNNNKQSKIEIKVNLPFKNESNNVTLSERVQRASQINEKILGNLDRRAKVDFIHNRNKKNDEMKGFNPQQSMINKKQKEQLINEKQGANVNFNNNQEIKQKVKIFGVQTSAVNNNIFGNKQKDQNEVKPVISSLFQSINNSNNNSNNNIFNKVQVPPSEASKGSQSLFALSPKISNNLLQNQSNILNSNNLNSSNLGIFNPFNQNSNQPSSNNIFSNSFSNNQSNKPQQQNQSINLFSSNQSNNLPSNTQAVNIFSSNQPFNAFSSNSQVAFKSNQVQKQCKIVQQNKEEQIKQPVKISRNEVFEQIKQPVKIPREDLFDEIKQPVQIFREGLFEQDNIKKQKPKLIFNNSLIKPFQNKRQNVLNQQKKSQQPMKLLFNNNGSKVDFVNPSVNIFGGSFEQQQQQSSQQILQQEEKSIIQNPIQRQNQNYVIKQESPVKVSLFENNSSTKPNIFSSNTGNSTLGFSNTFKQPNLLIKGELSVINQHKSQYNNSSCKQNSQNQTVVQNSSLFGSTGTPQTPGIFSVDKPSNSFLFGKDKDNANIENAQTSSNSNKNSLNLFSNNNSNVNNLFSNQSSSITGGLFSNASNNNNTGLFGSSSNNNNAGLFGSSGSTINKVQGGLFKNLQSKVQKQQNHNDNNFANKIPDTKIINQSLINKNTSGQIPIFASQTNQSEPIITTQQTGIFSQPQTSSQNIFSQSNNTQNMFKKNTQSNDSKPNPFAKSQQMNSSDSKPNIFGLNSQSNSIFASASNNSGSLFSNNNSGASLFGKNNEKKGAALFSKDNQESQQQQGDEEDGEDIQQAEQEEKQPTGQITFAYSQNEVLFKQQLPKFKIASNQNSGLRQGVKISLQKMQGSDRVYLFVRLPKTSNAIFFGSYIFKSAVQMKNKTQSGCMVTVHHIMQIDLQQNSKQHLEHLRLLFRGEKEAREFVEKSNKIIEGLKEEVK